MDLTAGETLSVRGENGATFDVDVPEAGSVQRELLEDALATGRLVITSDRPEPVEAPVSEVPDGTMEDVIEWVRGSEPGTDPAEGWQDRARQAIDAEAAKAKPRTTLIEALNGSLAEPEPKDT